MARRCPGRRSRRSPTQCSRRWRGGWLGRWTASIRWCSSTPSIVKVRDGQVANRAFYCAIGVTVEGKRDILGIWASPGAEGAKFWLGVLTEIRNRGVADVCIVVCDGLKGLARRDRGDVAAGDRADLCAAPDPQHVPLAGRQHWDAMARDLRPVYTAVNEADAKQRFVEFCDDWADRYPAVRTLWENAWAEFVPFLDYSAEIRRVIYSTNAIESLHARMRRATRARGHFPNEQAAMKCLYLVVRSLDPTGKGSDAMDEPMEARTQRLRPHLRGPALPDRAMTPPAPVTPLSRQSPGLDAGRFVVEPSARRLGDSLWKNDEGVRIGERNTLSRVLQAQSLAVVVGRKPHYAGPSIEDKERLIRVAELVSREFAARHEQRADPSSPQTIGPSHCQQVFQSQPMSSGRGQPAVAHRESAALSERKRPCRCRMLPWSTPRSTALGTST